MTLPLCLRDACTKRNVLFVFKVPAETYLSIRKLYVLPGVPQDMEIWSSVLFPDLELRFENSLHFIVLMVWQICGKDRHPNLAEFCNRGQ